MHGHERGMIHWFLQISIHSSYIPGVYILSVQSTHRFGTVLDLTEKIQVFIFLIQMTTMNKAQPSSIYIFVIYAGVNILGAHSVHSYTY